MGYLDFCFLIAYSVGLFISGNLGDRYPVRVIVPTGFFIVSIMTFMFAMGGSWGISSYWYYMAFFTMSGFFQSIGWPAFVPVMANWFSKKYRGLVLGIWCTFRENISPCQNFGNIGGALLVNLLRGYFGMNWILCFKVIAVIILILGFLNLFFLIGEPSNVGIDIDTTEELNSSNHNIDVKNNIDEEERISLDKNSEADPQEDVKADQHLQPIDKIDSSSRKMSEKVQEPKVGQRAISFWKAWTIPKVIPYAICLALVKLSTYGILLWLPVYADEALHYNNAAIGYLAVTYDIGTIVGSVVLGKISDIVYHKRSPVAFFGCLSGAIFFILVILTPGYINIIIFFVGFFVGGVFNVVAATAATDIAKSNAMDPKDKALSTISGINDG